MIKKIKYSIRFNILTLCLLLLILMGMAVTITYYYTAERILFIAGEKMLRQIGMVTEQYVAQLFLPGFNLLDYDANLIKKGIIVPGPNKEFTTLMLESIRNLPHNSIVAWCSPNGDTFAIERDGNNAFLDTTIICRNQICVCQEKKLDIENNILSDTKISSWNQKSNRQISGTKTPYDPRTRQWYKQAIAAKKPILSDVFLAIQFVNNNPLLSIGSANPVFAENGHLLGVLLLVTNLRSLSEYIAGINLTKNATIFVVDSNSKLIAAKYLKNFSLVVLPTIDALNLPWINSSLQHYKEKQQSLFTYRYGNVDYVAYYHIISNLRNTPLTIGIVVPANDLIGVLRIQIVHSILTIMIFLLAGAMVSWIISNVISKPIIKLADEMKQVVYTFSLSLTDVRSRIKEINYIQEAFNALKKSLQSFTRYVPITLVKQLLTQNTLAHIGGESKELTCIFADIQGFTTLSEKFTPTQLTKYLSDYFEVMTKIILKNKGTVDKYIGDCVMAFWGAPLEDNKHAYHACSTALEMQEALKNLNQNYVLKELPQLTIRIGINTGNMVVGNVGSEDRLNYTIFGDSVNIAYRVEEINKQYETKIIITQSTYQIVKNDFSLRYLDCIVPRGKTNSINLYELFGIKHN